jgi:hypothetical protein
MYLKDLSRTTDQCECFLCIITRRASAFPNEPMDFLIISYPLLAWA